MVTRVPEGYKKTEVGVIPADWKCGYFKDIAYIVMGQSPLGETYNFTGEGIALINGPTEFTEKYPIAKQWTTTPTKICEIGDILLCVRGSSTGRTNISNGQYCIGRGIGAISNKDTSNIEFIYFLLSSVISKILAVTAGSTFPNLTKDDLAEVKIAIPLLSEQTAIAATLSDIDSLIFSIEKLIVKKQNIKQGTMQELLTGKKRLSGFIGEWEEKKLGEICYYANGTSLEKHFNYLSGYQVISIGNYSLESKYIDNGVRIDVSFFNEVKKYILKKNDLTMILNDKTSSGEIIGRVLLIDDEGKYVFNQRTMRLRLINGNNSKYFYYLLNSQFMRKMIFDSSKPGTQIYINTNDVLELKTFYPPNLEEQTAIVKILSDMDKEIEILTEKLKKYTAIKQGMMQELLTGKRRLV